MKTFGPYLRRFFVSVFLSFALLHRLFAAVQISEDEFRTLTRDLAPKVTLFKEIWKLDPKAILYGGTSRDFLYWILGRLNSGETPEQLRTREQIDIRDIVGRESDIDVVSEREYFFEAEQFGVKKIDRISPNRLDPKTVEGRSELNQGYIPLEKIELGEDGLKAPTVFGDGVRELLRGELTFHSTEGETFQNTIFASQKLNHPVFLALRYLRIRAQHWHNTHGDELPTERALLNFDPALQNRLRLLIESAIHDPEFQNVIENKKALKWLNGSILKSFRSKTNQTAAYILLKAFGFQRLQSAHPTIETINQFLYRQDRDWARIAKNFAEFKISQPEIVFTDAKVAISGLTLLHGTQTEENFRGILFQNALPSTGGAAGAGLYAADLLHKDVAISHGGSVDRVTRFEVAETAKVMDITQGAGLELFNQWQAKFGTTYDDFAQAFGADILKYPYEPAAPYAFVVKNSDVLIKREGYSRKLMTVSEALTIARKVEGKKAFEELIKILHLNGFARPEAQIVLEGLPKARKPLLLSEIASDSDLSPTDLAFLIQNIPQELARNYLVQFVKKVRESYEGESRWYVYDAIFAKLSQADRDFLVSLLVANRDDYGAVRHLLFSSLQDLPEHELSVSETLFRKTMSLILEDTSIHKVILVNLAMIFYSPQISSERKSWFYSNSPAWISKIIKTSRSIPYIQPATLPIGYEAFDDTYPIGPISLLLIDSPKDSALIPWRELPEFSQWISDIAQGPNVPVQELFSLMTLTDVYLHERKDPPKAKLNEWTDILLANPHRSQVSDFGVLRFILEHELDSPASLNFLRTRLAHDTQHFLPILRHLKSFSKSELLSQRAVASALITLPIDFGLSVLFPSQNTILDFFVGPPVTDPQVQGSLLSYITLTTNMSLSDLRWIFDSLFRPYLATSEFAQLGALRLAERWILLRDADRRSENSFFPYLGRELAKVNVLSPQVEQEALKVFKSPFWISLNAAQRSEDCLGSLGKLTLAPSRAGI